LSDWIVLGGPASTDIAENLARMLNLELVQVDYKSFPDGEGKVRINVDVMNKKVIMVHGTHPPCDTHLVQALFIAHKLSQEGASVHACIPYLAYARQDSEFQAGEVVSLSTVSHLLRTAGVKSLVTVDIHSSHGLGYFSIPSFSISAIPLLAEYAKENVNLTDPLAVSPDFGGSTRVEAFARILGIEKISLKKARSRTTGEIVMEESNIEVSGRDILLVDDMISTGTSIQRAAKYLEGFGAKRVFALCTHPLLVGRAVEIMESSGVREVIGTNTVPSPVSHIDVTPILAEHYRTSLS
jgi:ribose-phosphate pyrophosphokinase